MIHPTELKGLIFTVQGGQTTAEFDGIKISADGFKTAAIDFIYSAFKSDSPQVYKNENRLIDTHTSVAVNAAKRFENDYKTAEPMLVVSTASPYKFAGDVLFSLSGEKPEDDLLAPEMLASLTGVEIPSPLARILGLTPVHLDVIKKEDMEASVRDFALSASK